MTPPTQWDPIIHLAAWPVIGLIVVVLLAIFTGGSDSGDG